MRPRTEVALALGALGALCIVVGLIGSMNNESPPADPRRSIAIAGPEGARGLAGALTALGVNVERLRRRSSVWNESHPADEGTLVVLLDPSVPLDEVDGRAIGSIIDEGGHVLLAGSGVHEGLACVGYLSAHRAVPVLAQAAGGNVAQPTFRASRVLVPWQSPVDTVRRTSDETSGCDLREVTAFTPLFVTPDSQIVAAEFEVESGGSIIAIADGELLSNRALRDAGNPVGPLMLGLIVPRFRRVLVDEYHHGFGPSGSLWPALRTWSATSPLGWALWQLALVGLIALATCAIRFGAIVPATRARRRSPLEHVKALAAALSASKGHEVATRLLVQGLRRRLVRRSEGLREDPRPWLIQLTRSVRAPEARAAAQRLEQLLSRRQDARDVLTAANAVEDVWETLTPRR